jgi:adenosylcobyric acid synthase
MVLGTASSAGKSTLAAALCRLYANRGVRVAPFKAQNMSNNAMALEGGFEIGRAQATQAEACRVEARVEMNPVLLKPEADSRCQVILRGKPWKTLPARDYYLERGPLWEAATSSLDALREGFDLVIAEGAGSPVEMNLKNNDIVNMSIVKYARARAILVGDVDLGGIFAQFSGTMALLDPEERASIAGLAVNKFRGDPALFAPALPMLERYCGARALGVIPWLEEARLAEEDATALERGGESRAEGDVDVAAIAFPRIANFDDLDAIADEKGVRLRWVRDVRELGFPDAIVLPGSKATRADLAWMRDRGFDDAVRHLRRCGARILGICAGYQMLGERIEDAEGVEGEPGAVDGLGLLPVVTRFSREKAVRRRKGRSAPGALPGGGGAVEGYEIHAGRVEARGEPAFELEAGGGILEGEGCRSADGAVIGTSLHGLFDSPGFRGAWLASLRPSFVGSGESQAYRRSRALDALASAAERCLDMRAIDEACGM